MIELTFGHNKYRFPGDWTELTQEQYLKLVESIFLFQIEGIPAENTAAQYFCKIANIKLHKKEPDLLWENIYRASMQVNFFITIKYEKPIKHLSIETQKMLKHMPPEMCPQTPEIRWASKLKYTYSVDPVFCQQLLPKLHSVKGYQLFKKGDVLFTDLTARQFIDSNLALEQYARKGNLEFLNELIIALYSGSESVIKKFTEIEKQAVLLNFQALISYIARETKFSILYVGAEVEKRKIRVGLSDSLYTLSKMGYGPVDDMEKLNLIKFLELQLKNLIDTVQGLSESGMDKVEIAEKTGLKLNQINVIL